MTTPTDKQDNEGSRDWGIVESLKQCTKLFETLIASGDPFTAQTAQVMFQALKIWSRYTGAKGRKGSSLDDRLRDNKDLKDAIRDLLRMIRSKLSQGMLTRPSMYPHHSH